MATTPKAVPEASSPPRLRLHITAAAESVLRNGHPWLYAESIAAQNREGELGELAAVYDRKDRFLAVGLFDPESPIRLRVLHAGKPLALDDTWWERRLEQALARRTGLFDDKTTGYRCINGESDGWPGLVLDRYDRTIVLKLYTAAWLPRLDDIVKRLQSRLNPQRIVLRLSRNIQNLARRRFSRTDGSVVSGEPLEAPVVFTETGVRFEAEVLKGQKTGFFLDQRENRRRVEMLAAGRQVLNAFSFSGGFSLYAARGGAKAVTDLDISPHALAGADRNFALNQSVPAIRACHHETIQCDVFEWLANNADRRFGLLILDPPSLAKRESEKADALRAYSHLISSGLDHLSPSGILMASSCSAHVSKEEFFALVRQAAARSGRRFQELETTLHAPDHPATFREAEYLKGIYLRFEG